MRDLFITVIAGLIAVILVALFCIVSAEIVLSIFDWLMGTAYNAPPNVGIGALIALIMFIVLKIGR